jgi:DNA-binding HxlR family transcriptional regulator
MDTMTLPSIPKPQPEIDHARTDGLAREILERVADKWTVLVIDALGTQGTLRFSRLREQIDGGISQKMLTKTLRQLERDGLVTRHVHAVVPPRVDYRLTPLGETLLATVCGIWDWVERYMDQVEAARAHFDGPQDTLPDNVHRYVNARLAR